MAGPSQAGLTKVGHGQARQGDARQGFFFSQKGIAMAQTKATNRIKEHMEAVEAPERAPIFELAKLRVRVVGISPLLCNNPTGSMKAPSKPGSARGSSEIKDAAQEAKGGLYIDADGDFAFPNAAIYSAIVTAAELMKLKVGTGRMAPSVAGMLIGGLSADYEIELAKLVDPKTEKPLKDYAVDSRRVVIPATGSSVVRCRPKFHPWAAVFNLRIDSGDPNLAKIMSTSFPQILAFAGLRVGIGDNRPYVRKTGGRNKQSFGGPFGRFDGSILD